MKLFAQKFARNSVQAVTLLQEKAKLQSKPGTVAQLFFHATELNASFSPTATRRLSSDLLFKPNVLNFTESNEQTFKVVDNSFATKTTIMACTGCNAPPYTSIPLSSQFSVERVFMQNTFQVSSVPHNEQARQYMFSIKGCVVHQQWVNAMGWQITRAVEANASDAPFGPLEAKLRWAAKAVAVQVLRDMLIAPDDRALQPQAGYTQAGSLGIMLAYGVEGPITGMQ
ncbi:hypothetical protein FRC08_000379 [Ceratobasidium sp. 394]|nr:hypothetical protein FRC08_000379 [Ceratobasidium sp. 394]